jgi:hypothetical protein
MRTSAIALAAVTASLAAPAAATAQPAPGGAPASVPALAAEPVLVREGEQRLALHVALNRPLPRRFDTEIRATAYIDGLPSSLQAVPRGRGSASCYAASVRARGAAAEDLRAGSRHEVSVLVDTQSLPTITATVRLRAPRNGASGEATAC